MQKFLICLILQINYCNGFIVPIEIPRLSENIFILFPTISKGTDSRLGFGFRFGNHADFQSILEIGPQKFTKSLGQQAEDSSNTKRMADNSNHSRISKITQPFTTKYHVHRKSTRDQYQLPKFLEVMKFFRMINFDDYHSRKNDTARKTVNRNAEN